MQLWFVLIKENMTDQKRKKEMAQIIYMIYVKIIYVASMALVSGVFLGSVTVAFFRHMDERENEEKIGKTIREVMLRPMEIHGKEEEESVLQGIEDVQIDFEKLKACNADIAGWIMFHNLCVNYPLVQADDNSYYLNHSFAGDKNVVGSIFIDCRNRSFEDRNVVIYGHGATKRCMFGPLKDIFRKKFWEEENNALIFLFDDDQNLRKYKVFSYYIVEKEDYYITTLFGSDSEYMEFLAAIQARSFGKTGVCVTVDDHILTLSACAGIFGTRRRVVHAKLLS